MSMRGKHGEEIRRRRGRQGERKCSINAPSILVHTYHIGIKRNDETLYHEIERWLMVKFRM